MVSRLTWSENVNRGRDTERFADIVGTFDI